MELIKWIVENIWWFVPAAIAALAAGATVAALKRGRDAGYPALVAIFAGVVAVLAFFVTR